MCARASNTHTEAAARATEEGCRGGSACSNKRVGASDSIAEPTVKGLLAAVSRDEHDLEILAVCYFEFTVHLLTRANRRAHADASMRQGKHVQAGGRW